MTQFAARWGHGGGMKAAILLCVFAVSVIRAADQAAIPNPLIDYRQFVTVAKTVQPVREKRRLTEEQFAALAAEPGTVVLDARSADKYALRHIRGRDQSAVH
jgi:hypothetical protein